MDSGSSGQHGRHRSAQPWYRRRRMVAAGVLATAALLVAVAGVTYASVEHRAPRSAPGRGAVRAAPAAVRSQPRAAGLVTTLPGPASFQDSAVIGPAWLAFSPGGTELAYSSGLGPLLVWNLATRQSASLTIPGSGSSAPSQAAFSPDGRTLAVGGFADAYLYDAATDHLTATLDTPGGADTLAFSPNAKLLATAGSLGPVYVWDVATSSKAATLTDPGGQAVGSEAFSPDSSLLAIADSSGRTYVWDVATSRLVATLADPDGAAVDVVGFSPGAGLLTAVTSDGSVYSWDVATWHLAATVTSPATVLEQGSVAWAFSPDGTLLAVGPSYSTSSTVYSVASGHVVGTFGDPDKVGIASVGFSPDSKVLAVADENGNITLWDVG